jgi:pimeloyl-ACP methyl ester carboxylesterase
MATYQHNNDIELFYNVYGTGNKVLIAFHGFTKDSTDYKMFENLLGNTYTIFAVDLFYHGKTKLNAKKIKSFTNEQLKDIIAGFITHLKAQKFSVIGYSMGGKIALFTLQNFNEKIENSFLLAPDGLKMIFWNWWVTKTKTGKYTYGYTIKKPQLVYNIAKIGTSTRILPQKIEKFVELNFGRKGIRLKIYRVWQLYKNINIDTEKINNNFKEKNKEILIFGGYKDPIIKIKFLKDFTKKNRTFKLIELKAGHDLFKEYLREDISNEILKAF